MSVFGQRLKTARLEAGLSQEQLGIEAGLDPMSASAQMNRYELGKRAPNYDLAVALGKVLGVPAAYFYASKDDEAELLLAFQRMSGDAKRKLLQSLRLSRQTLGAASRQFRPSGLPPPSGSKVVDNCTPKGGSPRRAWLGGFCSKDRQPPSRCGIRHVSRL